MWNFPTALAALTVLNTFMWWLLILPGIVVVMTAMYMLIGYIAGLRGGIGLAEIGGISADRWEFRAFGAMSTMAIGLALAIVLAGHPWPQRAARIIATSVLVATQFSYNHTCAVSSEDRLVARLQDRKEMKVSMVSIADVRFWRDIRFTTGTCDQAIEP